MRKALRAPNVDKIPIALEGDEAKTMVATLPRNRLIVSSNCATRSLNKRSDLEEKNPEADKLVPHRDEREAKEETKNAAKLSHQKKERYCNVAIKVFSILNLI